MANLKTGLAYYNVETGRYQDIKIKRLKKDFGCNGIAVYDYLLCEIYRDKGCFLEWDESTVFDVAEYFGLKENLVKEIVNYCAFVGLFNKELLCRESVLTSRSIQQRYIDTCTRAKRKNFKIPEKYVILTEESPKMTEEYKNTTEVCGEEKKSKEYIPPISPLVDPNEHVSIERLKDHVINFEQAWTDVIGMNRHLTPGSINKWLETFFSELEMNGETEKSLKDFKSHFNRWLKIQLEKNGKQEKDEPIDESPPSVYRRRKSPFCN